ncbi:MAG: hypothetical protein AMXMBFR31_23810 [Candidatus Desulfobacillus denitrificans]|jgi:hypothetical protein|nr:hypothetical protein [Rhodocyclaceae bacterium]MCZ2175625.1 hypothetical protein [Burkholderiales bacterium]
MKFAALAATALIGASLAVPVLAQPGPGMGPGSGMGPGMGPGMGGMGGMGPGARGMQYRFNQNNTPGWSLMTPEERTAHHDKMMAAKTYEECKAAQAEQHQQMAARAKEKGQTLSGPRQNACDRMKARGFYK